MTETQQTMTEFTYATGETDVIGDRFSPSVVLFWLKTSVADGMAYVREYAREGRRPGRSCSTISSARGVR